MKRGLIPFIFLSLLASGLNYFAYPALGRLLPSSQYVNITVSLSLFTQISTFLSSLTAITIGLSKTADHTNTIHKLQVSLLQIFSLFGVIFLVFSPIIMSMLDTPVSYAVPIVIMILMSIPVTIISGYLNGRQLMTKLGLVAALTASLQFVTGLLVALLSQNGFITMLCMGLTQLISISILIRYMGESEMPHLGSELFVFKRFATETYRLLGYVILASFAIMAVNLLQIFDLLVIKNMNDSTARFYTDIYIISRIIFFGGMILVWPFLGELSLTDQRHNIRAFSRLVSWLTAIGLSLLTVFAIAGRHIVQLLFGQLYPYTSLSEALFLSTLYKLFFLVIVAISLYFIVFRDKRSILYPLFVSFATIFSYVISDHSSINSVLTHLTAAALLCAAIGSYALIRFNPVRRLAVVVK